MVQSKQPTAHAGSGITQILTNYYKILSNLELDFLGPSPKSPETHILNLRPELGRFGAMFCLTPLVRISEVCLLKTGMCFSAWGESSNHQVTISPLPLRWGDVSLGELQRSRRVCICGYQPHATIWWSCIGPLWSCTSADCICTRQIQPFTGNTTKQFHFSGTCVCNHVVSMVTCTCL